MPRKAITIKEVAQLANVSRATAARALNGYGYVSDEVATRVRNAATELGYMGNRLAQALRQGQPLPLIGFVPGDIQNPFFAQIAHDVDMHLRQSHHNLLIASSEEDLDQERELVNNLLALNIRGIVIAPTADDSQQHLQKVLDDNIPLVLIDRMAGDLVCDSITVDNEGGAREAVEYLIANGHRRIAVIHDDSRIETARQRLAGYTQALAKHGIDLNERLITVSRSTIKYAIEATIRLFSQPQRPTALFTVDSLMTQGALLALRSMGLSIPQDVSLIGFDDFELATFTDPQITVVAQPTGRIGSLAAQMLLERINNSEAPPQHVRFPTKLLKRGSVTHPVDDSLL